MRFQSLAAFATGILISATSEVRAELDPGEKIMTVKVTLDSVTIFAGDETSGGKGSDEMRLTSIISQVGHSPNNQLIHAFASSPFESGVCKEEPPLPGNEVVLGRVAYFHVECTRCASMKLQFRMWEDDNWESEALRDVIEELLPPILEGFEVNGPTFWAPSMVSGGLAIVDLLTAEGLLNGADARSVVTEERNCAAGAVQHQASLILKSPGSQGGCDMQWQEGDVAATLKYTVTVQETAFDCLDEKGLFNNVGMRQVVQNFMDQITMDTDLRVFLLEKFGIAADHKRAGQTRETRQDVDEIWESLANGISASAVERDDALQIFQFADFLLEDAEPHLAEVWIAESPAYRYSSTCAAADTCGANGTPDEQWLILVPAAGEWSFRAAGESWLPELTLGSASCDSDSGTSRPIGPTSAELIATLAPGAYFLTVDGETAASCGAYELVVTSSGPSPCCFIGDSNDDGVIDFTDLVTLLANWGPCTNE